MARQSHWALPKRVRLLGVVCALSAVLPGMDFLAYANDNLVDKPSAGDMGTVLLADADESQGPGVVREAQRYLQQLGYYRGRIDGVMDRDTSLALMQFKRTAKIRPGGGLTDEVMVELRAQAGAPLMPKVQQSSVPSQSTIGEAPVRAASTAEPCVRTDPADFDQVFACMSSARWSRGMGTGRNPFEGSVATSSCSAIARTYAAVLHEKAGISRGEMHKQMPGCAIFARATREISGKAPHWEACIGYSPHSAQAHMSQCLTGYLKGNFGSEHALTERVAGCASAIAYYERGLRAASIDSQLPPGYLRPDCKQVLASVGSESAVARVAPGYVGDTPDYSHSMPDMSKDPRFQTLKRCLDSYTQCRKQLLASPHVCRQQHQICLMGDQQAQKQKSVPSVQKENRPTPAPSPTQPRKINKLPDPDPIEEVKATAIAAALALNAEKSKTRSVAIGKAGEVPEIDRRELELGTVPGNSTIITTSPTEFFWTSMGNQLTHAATTLRQVNERNKALRRHARKLHKALEVCCSCPYREEILDEFVKWQADALWNTQVTQNAMGALRGDVDFGQLIPSREQDRQRLIAMAPPPCEPPTEVPEPRVEADDSPISIYRKVDWGLVPEDFRLPTPPRKPTRGNLLYMAHVQTPGRLTATAIDYHRRHTLPGYDDLSRTEQDIFEKDVATFWKDPVLHCYYVSPDYQGSKLIRYWYRKRPDDFDVDHLRSSLRNHPILQIRAPNDACPQDVNTAEAMPF